MEIYSRSQGDSGRTDMLQKFNSRHRIKIWHIRNDLATSLVHMCAGHSATSWRQSPILVLVNCIWVVILYSASSEEGRVKWGIYRRPSEKLNAYSSSSNTALMHQASLRSHSSLRRGIFVYRWFILIWLITGSGVKYFTDKPLDKFRLH